MLLVLKHFLNTIEDPEHGTVDNKKKGLIKTKTYHIL